MFFPEARSFANSLLLAPALGCCSWKCENTEESSSIVSTTQLLINLVNKYQSNTVFSGASEPYHRLLEKFQAEHAARKTESKNENNNNREDPAFSESKFEGAEMSPAIDEADEDAEEEDLEKKLEISVDLLKNTPLLWATYKGHLRIIWLLLNDGYSPNDTDNMSNNALHLAAVNGDVKILKILIDDGASATLVNIYKNRAIDMATNKEARDILAVAMEATASMTQEDMVAKHEANMKKVCF